MPRTIQLRRNTSAQRAAKIYDIGEPVWITDTKQLVVGDGSTVGGNATVMAGVGVTGTKVIGDADGVSYHHITLSDGRITDWTTNTTP